VKGKINFKKIVARYQNRKIIQTYNESSDEQLLSSVMDWQQNASGYIQRFARDKHVIYEDYNSLGRHSSS